MHTNAHQYTMVLVLVCVGVTALRCWCISVCWCVLLLIVACEVMVDVDGCYCVLLGMRDPTIRMHSRSLLFRPIIQQDALYCMQQACIMYGI